VISGRTVVVNVDRTFRDTRQRIREAQMSGDAVVIVSVRDEEETTLTLLLPSSDVELVGLKVNTDLLSPGALDLGRVIDELEGVTTEASYVGSWYYPFTGGCIIYTFDAHGSGVDTIESDVQAGLGLYDAEAARQEARNGGFDPR
jgi:hypothetical protein